MAFAVPVFRKHQRQYAFFQKYRNREAAGFCFTADQRQGKFFDASERGGDIIANAGTDRESANKLACRCKYHLRQQRVNMGNRAAGFPHASHGIVAGSHRTRCGGAQFTCGGVRQCQQGSD